MHSNDPFGLKAIEAKRIQDAERYQNNDHDLCQCCHAYGSDKRSLFVACFYQIDEMIPEFIDLHNTDSPQRGYYMRICKTCRARFLRHLEQWYEEGVRRRKLTKDHDGEAYGEYGPEANIPVRINGATVMMTAGQYATYKESHQ